MALTFILKFSRLLTLFFIGVIGAAAFAVPSFAAPPVPRFEPVTCGFKDEAVDWQAKNGVTCGWVTVKAHHDHKDSATLRLWVVKVAANGPAPGPRAALIRIWWGPMVPNITPTVIRDATLLKLFRTTRDVIFFDYRGMGHSEPKTNCIVAPITGATINDLLRSSESQSAECRRQIEAAGTDLSALNAAAAPQDIQDIAQAMEYPTYDIWGVSYGSFPALDLIRQRPAGLRAAIIGVAIPPDSASREQFSTFGRGLAAMQRECNQDAKCHARFPDMVGSLGRAMARLDRERLMGHSRRLMPVDLYSALFQMGAITAMPERVPLAIDFAEKGNAALVAKWLDVAKGEVGPELSLPDAAAQVVLVCNTFADGNPTKPDVEAAARKYPYLVRATKPTDASDRLCDIWKISSPPRETFMPAKSDIPVLFYSARFDMAVANADTIRVAKMLPHSTIVEVPGAGHSFSDDCLSHLEAAFLVNPSGVLDRSCTATMKPIKFALDGFETYVAGVVAH